MTASGHVLDRSAVFGSGRYRVPLPFAQSAPTLHVSGTAVFSSVELERET